MDFLSFVAVVLLVIFLVTIILILFSDGDLSLMFHDKFGKKLKTLQGKVIWITGASTGIGEALAIEGARQGAKLVLSARTQRLLEEVKTKCLDSGRYFDLKSEDVLVLPMDMTDFQSHSKSVETVLEHFGKLDMVIHNAGRSQRARWEHTDLTVDKDLFDLNVFSVVNLSRAVMPHFAERGGGIFGIMSSTAGKCGVPFSGTYTGSKHALHGYFESLRTEKIGCNIQVTMLCPGPTFSNLLKVAATEEPGQHFGECMNPTDKRMTSTRCAHLSLVALAHGLEEAWICFMPVLPLMYISQYCPTLSKRLMNVLGPKFFAKVRDSRDAMNKTK